MVDTYDGRKSKDNASWRRPLGGHRNVWLNKVQEDANDLMLYLRCGGKRQRQVWLIPIADERVGVQVKL